MRYSLSFSLILSLYLAIAPVLADSKTKLGPVTSLEMPRYVSVKTNKSFLRRGPGKSFRIDWILETPGFPLKVIAEYENWRQVEDYEGDKGWIFFRLLSGKRTVITINSSEYLRQKFNPKSKPIALLEAGAIGKFIRKSGDSCEVAFKGFKGWVDSNQVWGC